MKYLSLLLCFERCQNLTDCDSSSPSTQAQNWESCFSLSQFILPWHMAFLSESLLLFLLGFLLVKRTSITFWNNAKKPPHRYLYTFTPVSSTAFNIISVSYRQREKGGTKQKQFSPNDSVLQVPQIHHPPAGWVMRKDLCPNSQNFQGARCRKTIPLRWEIWSLPEQIPATMWFS